MTSNFNFKYKLILNIENKDFVFNKIT